MIKLSNRIFHFLSELLDCHVIVDRVYDYRWLCLLQNLRGSRLFLSYPLFFLFYNFIHANLLFFFIFLFFLLLFGDLLNRGGLLLFDWLGFLGLLLSFFFWVLLNGRVALFAGHLLYNFECNIFQK